MFGATQPSPFWVGRCQWLFRLKKWALFQGAQDLAELYTGIASHRTLWWRPWWPWLIRTPWLCLKMAYPQFFIEFRTVELHLPRAVANLVAPAVWPWSREAVAADLLTFLRLFLKDLKALLWLSDIAMPQPDSPREFPFVWQDKAARENMSASESYESEGKNNGNQSMYEINRTPLETLEFFFGTCLS
jgi:hypothetical protein